MKVSPPPVRCSSFMGIRPMVVATLLSPSFSLQAILARLATRIWLRFFVFLATGHFLGSGRTSFRFSTHCVPSCLPACLLACLPACFSVFYFFVDFSSSSTSSSSSPVPPPASPPPRPLRMRRRCTHERVQAGPDYPYLFLPARTHARTYRCTACVVRRAFPIRRYGRGIFALEHTRQPVSLNTAATWRRLNAKVEAAPRAKIFAPMPKKRRNAGGWAGQGGGRSDIDLAPLVRRTFTNTRADKSTVSTRSARINTSQDPRSLEIARSQERLSNRGTNATRSATHAKILARNN